MFCRAHGQFFKVPVGFLLAINHTKTDHVQKCGKPIGKQMKCNIQGVNLLLRRVQPQEFVYRIKCEDVFTGRPAWFNSAGVEVSECTADGNKTGSFERIPNLQTCQGRYLPQK